MTVSLTNPGLVYDQGQGTDPTTGMSVQLPPIVKYFKNAALQGHQAALDEMASVQPGRSDISGPNGTPAQLPQPSPVSISQPAAGGALSVDPATTAPDTNQVTQSTGTSSMPKMFKPSFSQSMAAGPAAVNPAQTKLGKLVSILAAAGQGALAGWGTGNAAAGADRAREIPFQNAAQSQQLQTGALENQQRTAGLRMLPLDIAQRQTQIQQTLQQMQNEKTKADIEAHGIHSTVYQPDPNDNNGYVQQGLDVFGNPVGKGTPAMLPGFLKPHTQLVTIPDPQNPNGPPKYAVYDKLRNQVTDMNTGAVIPGAEKFVEGLVPKTTSSTTSSSTDLMGNTTERKQNITGPVGAGTPSPTAGNTARSTGAQSGAKPKTATAPASTAPVSLPPDVEQRLGASGLNSQEQQYVRGLLGYQGQMPSPRARNYAATLATLTSIDPNFNAANYDTNKKTMEEYTPGGSVGKQAIGFNTSIAHLDMLDQAAQALKSSDYPSLNKIAQYLKVQSGDSAVTTFNNIADAVDGEVSKTFKGTATEGELARVGAHFNSALGPQQIQGNIRSTIGLLNGKMGEMESAFERQTGRPIHLVSPQAQAALQRMTTPAQAGMVTMKAPDGTMRPVPAAQVEHYKSKGAVVVQ